MICSAKCIYSQGKPRKHDKDSGNSRGSSSSSLAYILVVSALCALSLLSCNAWCMAHPAHAATWPVSTSALSATVSFHQTYSAGTHSYVHSGIDIPASAGMQISAPMAGTVRFTGAVPSGDSKLSEAASLKTMNAVSIEMQEGNVITLMPFAAIGVKEGQTVSEGQPLGTLAATGDTSSSGSHLHMGYKSGSTYMDPMLLFGIAEKASAEESPRPREGLAGEPSAPSTVDAGTAPLDAPRGLQPEGALELPSVSEQPAAEGVFQESSCEPLDPIETGAYELRVRSDHESAPVEAIKGLLMQFCDACAEQLVSFADALTVLSKGTGIPLPVVFTAVPLLAIGAIIALGVIALRFMAPHVRSAVQSSRPACAQRITAKHFACH